VIDGWKEVDDNAEADVWLLWDNATTCWYATPPHLYKAGTSISWFMWYMFH